MEKQPTATIRMFGIFHTLHRERGISTAFEIPVSRVGRPALEIARELNLPLEMVGAVYCNHSPSGLNQIIRPGDRIAFVPKGVPGPHKCLQGIPSSTANHNLPGVPGGFNSSQLSVEGDGASLS